MQSLGFFSYLYIVFNDEKYQVVPRYSELPLLNTATKYQATPHPPYAICGGLGGIDHLVTLSFGDKILSFLVAGCLWLFQSPFRSLAQ